MRSKHSNRYWSSGKVFCGECGGRFTVVYKTLVDGTRYRAYRCISSAKAGREHYKNGVKVGCNSVQLKEESIMYCIKECLHHIQYDKKLIIENVFKELNNALIEEKPINLNEVKYKIETIQAKKSKALDMYLSETVDEETYRTTMVKYDKELDKLNEQLETANDIMRAREQTKKDIKKIEREMNIVLNYDGDNENLFSNIIKRIEIFGDRTLLITFTFLPMYQFCVKMHTEGKAGTFKTCINSLEIRTLEQEVQYSN